MQSNPRLFSVRARDEGMRNETANSRLKIGKRAQHCLVSLATSFSRLRHSPDRSEKKNQEISYINFLVVDVKFASSTVVKKKKSPCLLVAKVMSCQKKVQNLITLLTPECQVKAINSFAYFTDD